jgi:hypothetical protein
MDHVSRSAFALGAAGFTFSFGRERRKGYYLVVANDLIQGNSTGTTVLVTTGSDRSVTSIPYGSVRTLRLTAGTWIMTGNGAIVDFECSDDPVPLVVQTVVLAFSPSITIGNRVGVSIDNQTVGVAPSASLAGAGIDPRSGVALSLTAGGALIDPRAIRALTTADVVSDVRQDGNGVVLPQPYNGGANCPATGWWEFVARVTTGGTPITINGNALVPVGFSGALTNIVNTADFVYRMEVTKGTTYTFAGGTMREGKIGP